MAPEDLRMDMPLEVFFEAVTDEVTLPKFRRADSLIFVGIEIHERFNEGVDNE